MKQGMTLAMIITLAISGGIMLMAKPLLSILTNDPDVISTTYEMMTYFVPFYFTWTAIEVLSAVLRGAGDAVNPVIIIALGICLFRIVWIATVFASIGTLASLCWCYVASWTVTSIALIIYYKKGGWIKRRRMVIHN